MHSHAIRCCAGYFALALLLIAQPAGAMDAAAPFAERGLAVTLVLSAAAEMAPAAMGDVVAFDTNSRYLPPAEAAAAVARCIAALPRGTPLV